MLRGWIFSGNTIKIAELSRRTCTKHSSTDDSVSGLPTRCTTPMCMTLHIGRRCTVMYCMILLWMARKALPTKMGRRFQRARRTVGNFMEQKEQTKICSTCRRDLPLSIYHKNKKYIRWLPI